MDIPSNVAAIVDTKLEGSEKATVLEYIDALKLVIEAKDKEISELKGETDEAATPTKGDEKKTADDNANTNSIDTSNDDNNNNDDDDDDGGDEPSFPPLYDTTSGQEDFDKAGDAKQMAANCKASGDWEKALEHYTTAVLAAPPSALLYANRANALLKLGRPKAAERDCAEALKTNPDSAKALRIRGKARKQLGNYEEARKDLSASQTIDFDEGTVEDLKWLSEQVQSSVKERASLRVQEENKLRERAASIKKAQDEAKKEKESARASARASASGMPGGMAGGVPGGMGGGMPDMSDIMSDPELMAAMQNPKVMAAMQELMTGGGANPAKVAELASDPEVGPALMKLMSKFGGAGMGGSPGMGGGASPYNAAGATGVGDDDDDDVPDLEDLPELD